MFGDLQQLGWPGICSTPGLLWWKQLNVAQLYFLLNRLITKGMTLHSQCTLRMSCARECVSVWVCVVGVSVCERYIVLNSWLNQNDFCHGVHPLWVTYPMMLRPKYQVDVKLKVHITKYSVPATSNSPTYCVINYCVFSNVQSRQFIIKIAASKH